MLFLLLIAIFTMFLLLMPKKQATSFRSGGVMVSRSRVPDAPPGRITCGNCRGTGEDGFGIMPDSFPCDACDGRGSVKIDPNAKYISFEELLKGENLD